MNLKRFVAWEWLFFLSITLIGLTVLPLVMGLIFYFTAVEAHLAWYEQPLLFVFEELSRGDLPPGYFLVACGVMPWLIIQLMRSVLWSIKTLAASSDADEPVV